MQLPTLHMESQFAKIQIHQKDAKLEIKQEQPQIMIQQPKPEVTIHTTPSKLSIDQSKAWADMDLLSIFERNNRFAAEALQAVQAGIARIAREGKELMEIENGGNPIVAQAKRTASPPPKELGIKFIPSPFAVKTDYQPAEVHIDVTTHKPRIDAEIHAPQFTYHPGEVRTNLLQRNYLKVIYENTAK